MPVKQELCVKPPLNPKFWSLKKAAPTDAELPVGLSDSLFLARYASQNPGPKLVKACSDF